MLAAPHTCLIVVGQGINMGKFSEVVESMMSLTRSYSVGTRFMCTVERQVAVSHDHDHDLI
jgi:hypothetical protein